MKKRILAVLLSGVFVATPLSVHAFIPFGGQVYSLLTCINGILVTVGPPRGGEIMWVPGTRTYLYGPPTHTGQWLLGNAAPPTICFVPCSVGLCPAGAGLTMILQGSSAI